MLMWWTLELNFSVFNYHHAALQWLILQPGDINDLKLTLLWIGRCLSTVRTGWRCWNQMSDLQDGLRRHHSTTRARCARRSHLLHLGRRQHRQTSRWHKPTHVPVDNWSMDVTDRNKIQMYGFLVLLGLFHKHLSLHVIIFKALSYKYCIYEATLSSLLKSDEI